MRSGIRYSGKAHTVTMDSCPCCGRWCKVEFSGQRILGIKHATFASDQACPYVKQQDANPANRFQRMVFDYNDLEDRGIAARESVRRQEIRESRLDGRRPVVTDPTNDSSTLEDLF